MSPDEIASLAYGGRNLSDMHSEEACHDNYDDDHANDVEDIHRLAFFGEIIDCQFSLFYGTTNVDTHSNRRRQTVE
jgi:hypothetical protein